MLRKICLWGLIFLLTLVSIGGCTSGNQISYEPPQGALRQETLLINVEGSNFNIENLSQYNIKVELDDKTDQLHGYQEVKYFNNSKQELSEVYFNLFPNAFKDKTTAPTLFDREINELNYRGGSIEFSNILVNDKKVNYEVSGMGETLLKIPLEETILTGDSIVINMEYTIQIPTAKERFGVSEGVYNLGNWYPIAAVFDENGWNLEPYYSIGDPFYSEVANYYVEIILPKEMILASSGNITDQKVKGNKRTWNVEAKLMRDFAWCSSKQFIVEETMVGDTVVKMYFLTKDSQVRKKAIVFTTNSLKTFNRIFGKYPYGQYSVVATTFPSGMEYPGLVYIGQQYYDRGNLDALELIIVHETGHQWWYGVVGNDQINEAWLDESLTTFSEVVYFREVYGEKVGADHHEKRNEAIYNVSKEHIKDERVLRPLSEFVGWADYGSLVYHKGARMLYALEKLHGKDKMYKILSTYFQRYQFKVATTDDFIKICEEILKIDQKDFFAEWLSGRE